MSIDGSFSLQMELERLLLRCPKLSAATDFASLLAKGSEVKEEEVVNAVANVFLHPSYTIPIMGCFRPIARKIVQRVVDLMKLVPQLSFGVVNNNNNSMDKFFIGCEEFDGIEGDGVIEVYFRHGRFLDLHDVACLAFCRVLDLAPFLKWVVDSYFEFGGPPFVRIIRTTSISNLGSDAATHLRDIVWTSYRFLLLEVEYFSSRWDWCCFLDFVHQSGKFDTSSDVVSDIKWCGVQIMCVLLRLPNRSASLGVQPVDDLTCLLRWREFCWDVSIEKAGWYTSRAKSPYVSDGVLSLNGGDIDSVNGLELLDYAAPKRPKRCLMRNREPFLMTSAMKSSCERVIMAVNQKWPVLLYGPPGCGKTALLNKLAEESGNEVLSIHMDEHIDGKTLIGGYVCTELPGEFRWQPGPLTQAVKTGLWVVFENIDQAASDVQSILLPLLEGSSSFLTGYGEAIRVAEGFRLFSTISTSKVDLYHCTEGKCSLSSLWRRVMVKPAATTDLVNIVSAWYPDLEPVAEKLIETFETLNGNSEVIVPSNMSSSSKFSLRDLLKWCKRIAGSGFSFSVYGLSEDTRSGIFREAVDIFAAYSASPQKRLDIVRDIAEAWKVSPSKAETLNLDRPVLQDFHGEVTIGRVTLPRRENAVSHKMKRFVNIQSSSLVLERIACGVKWNEPVLLVGETGTGKTTLVQHLAAQLGQKLTVLNLSQQSDVADLLGGFKPMDPQHICVPLYNEFRNLFQITFSEKENEGLLSRLKKHAMKKNWTSLLSDFHKCVQRVAELGKCGPGTKRKRPLNEKVMVRWETFSQKVGIARKQINASSGMIFSFVEGAFVTALRNGEWILLDEVNLAPLETLQRIIGVLDRESSSLCLVENGVFVDRHPNFRLFACMNPATDAGKRDLPYALRSRFTEYFVDDVLDDAALSLFVSEFIKEEDLVSKIVRFYKAAKKDSEGSLQDGANQSPQYSLRSLYRALEYTNAAKRLGIMRALYDGFCMFFMTLLDGRSAAIMNKWIVSNLLGAGKNIKLPPPVPLDRLLEINERAGSEQFLQDYVLTKTVEEHIRSLARAVFIKKYPVLLQGPTSSGKTSLVQYLAAKTGHEFVRINNHEHTDLQEYLGSYITDASGKLVFHEGVLVKAVRNGHWIVLDELNLAPTDVLEALNRLLDDNRELFVPELRETVHAHPNFMLFATQNPPTIYGGRKMLSRAFRNRFVELHVDEIPEKELTEILEKKGKIPRSYAEKMIKVMNELQLRRQNSKVFAGKHGFITPRDLFRWASRFQKYGLSYEDLARDGYYLLAERLRDASERKTVQEVLEKQLNVKLKTHELYNQGSMQTPFPTDTFQEIVPTRSMERLFFLVERCYELREPVLLVGETGGGKTTVCQLLSLALKAKANLHILNCHQYTETSDFIGGFYPIRERPRLASDFKSLIEQLLSKAFIHSHVYNISADIGKAPSTLYQLATILDNCKQCLTSVSGVSEQDIAYLEKVKEELSQLYQKWQTIFMWQDGPLVESMKHGELLLVDEISLADDSVLERLNSVLEPDRKLSLAEKGGSDLETITAHEDFFLLATMNPGGDFGKKELSPALRNRFTEIWVPSVDDMDELRAIARRFLTAEHHHFVDPLINFWDWYNQQQTGRALTVRDLLAWLDFVTNTMKNLQPDFAFIHGAFLVLLDGLSLGTGISKNEAAELRQKSLAYLVKQLKDLDSTIDESKLSSIENYGWGEISTTLSSVEDEMQCDNIFGINPFFIPKGCAPCEEKGFEFLAPTTSRNVMRVLRAMQLRKPVLLEGSPGVGKTSLISAIGKFSGHNVVRINLSDQTDIMDLLGSDLPIESDDGLQFAWSDGILLQALREGSWVLLDEINLAQQSVLEGLNAILDHRAEVFIPELGRSFKCPPSFRVFACQNPTHQGGGRKGLPKSFLNRFTKVYVDELSEKDYHFICRSLFPAIHESILSRLILFNKRLYEDTMLHRKFALEGSPWEFNLRDVIRSCEIIQGAPENRKCDCFLNVVYVQRMRTTNDRREVVRLYEDVFGTKPLINPYPRVELDDHYLHVGGASIKRNTLSSSKTIGSELKILPGFRNCLEATVQCIQQQWLCIMVGPTASGKTSLIRLLAQLTGNVLKEINLSSATDISELLGSFEQYNAYRNFGFVVNQIEGFVNDYCSSQLDSSADTLLGERRDLIAKWLKFSSNVNYGHMSRSNNGDGENWRDSLSLLVEIVELLTSVSKSHISSTSWGLEDLSKVLQKVRKLQAIQTGQRTSVKFEWAAGLLIKAIENGEWIVLEDANLCNPTVLDRINSLAESNGSITVNECGNVDGKPLVLFPHPNFRMFLTVNPRHGEVSRAMRNRGIEIVVMQPHWLLDTYDQHTRELELDDVKTFLALSDIPTKTLVDSMAEAHIHAKIRGLALHIEITYLELSRWVHLFQKLLMTGNDVLWSLHKSWEHSYLSSLGESSGWDIVREVEALYLTNSCSVDAFGGQLSLCLAGGWPTSLKLTDFVWYTKGAFVQRDCMYLEYLGAECTSSKLQSFNKDRRSKSIYLVNSKQLQTIMYPKGVNGEIINYFVASDSDAVITESLNFAIDWVMEQVTGPMDIELNLLWFRWFNSQLQPFCQLFGSVEGLLREELKHPIWECIFQMHKNIDAGLHSLPILALEPVDVLARVSISSSIRLCNAVKSVGLLRASLRQWNCEVSSGDADLKSLMQSFRKLEEEVLSVIIESPIFDCLHQTYIDLLEVHILLWNAVNFSQFEALLVHWRALIKIVLKLRKLFPDAVENVLNNLGMMASILSRRLPFSLSSEKSLLWAYGGHPSLPQSADIFYKLQQLVTFAKLVWPSKINFTNQIDGLLSETAASTNPELRLLAMQGVCMSSCLDKTAENVAERLEEMHLILSRRYESEKSKFEVNEASPISGYTLAVSKCCTVVPEVMCNISGFETWSDSISIVDETSLLLDLLLLENLSEIVVADARDLQTILYGLNDRLENSCDLAIRFSSRTPLDFVPHQEIMWIVDAWLKTPEAGSKVVSSVHAMWFNWHSSLWNCRHLSSKELSGINAFEFELPSMLAKPVKTVSVHHIMQKPFVMKDYQLHRLKLRVASSNILRSVSPSKDMHSSLLRAARSLFHQIISAHKKSFTTKDFVAIGSRFVSLQKGVSKGDDIEALITLLASSRHKRFVSLVKPFLEPLLRELADTSSSDDLLLRISYAWLRLGGLRFHLLLACDELDPALKYSTKYQKLVNKCKSLSTEIKVRQHCDYLVGSLSSRKSDEEKAKLLEKHESECKRLQKKIVFRSDPGKFFRLKEECREFSENVDLGLKLLQENNMALSSLISRAGNWQVTASQFVDRLSEEYSSYIDIIQPIQVAVYEMKLGMALLLTNALQKNFLERVPGSKVDCVMDAIYSFMRFPHNYPFERHITIDVLSPKYPIYTVDLSVSIWVEKMDLLKQLVTSTGKIAGEKKVSSFDLEASLSDNMLRHVVDTVAITRTLDNASFRIIDGVFNFFTSWWKDMKVDEETKRDTEAQLYKFKPRALKLDDACDIDLSTLGNSFSSESFSEWKELLHDEESVEKKESVEQSESSGQSNMIPDSMMHTLVNAHNQLFGSSNLAETPGVVHVSDADKIHSFIKTYTLGASVVKDLTGIDASCLDGRLVAEHMFRLCLEHEQEFPLSENSDCVRRFYKDPNPPVVASMVTVLLSLRDQFISFLKVRDEDQGLMKLLEITEMLLALPPSTSVAQALSGLQFLVSRVKSLQAGGAKLPINDVMERIHHRISIFLKMEIDSWKTVLDEVLVQFEMNAAKLWFPLYSVLHRKNCTDIVEYAQTTLQSLEELVRTSNLGEYRRRLQLILSFYGQLNAGIHLGSYTSCTDKENRDILYNVFGFYVQSLPLIMKHIETTTKSIKKEVANHKKLCGWEMRLEKCPEKHLDLENSKRQRQKLKKLIKKYTDELEQPVMLVLTQEYARRSLQSLKLGNNATLKNPGTRLETQSSIPVFKDLEVDTIECPGLAYKEYWSIVRNNLEKVSTTVAETAVIWKEEGKLQVKTRLFSDLLKLLEKSGLSKHKSSLLKLLENSTLFKSKPGMLNDQNERCQSERWFFLPAYDMHHLLPKLESLFSHEFGVESDQSKSSKNTSLEDSWKCANQLYFKSLASVKNLEQISLNFHKDFNPDQVNRSISFLGHLLIIQMEQRAAAFDFTRRLNDLKEISRCIKKLSACKTSTEGPGDGVTICSGQHLLLRCMWQQKELFDAVCSTLDKESLMFETIQKTHLSTCQNTKSAANDIIAFLNKKIQLAKDSKAFLDGELLGRGPCIKLTGQMRAIVITKEMEQTVIQNFKLIRELQEDLLALREQGMNKRAVAIMIEQFRDIFEKAEKLEEQFHSSLHPSKPPVSTEIVSELDARMGSYLDDTCVSISNALQKLGSWSSPVDVSSDNITSCKYTFDSYASVLQLDHLSQELDNLIMCAVKLANDYGLSGKTGQFIRLEELLNLALKFSDSLLLDFMTVHQMISSLTLDLAEVFACLFSDGYGRATEEAVDDSSGKTTEDASGTGMGEGVGVQDVSDQITDEDQLLGTSKEEQKQDGPDEIPSKDVEGIEMDQEFDAPAQSVSEDSDADDNDKDDDDEVDKLDSEMGATGEDGQIADEKLFDKEEDEDLDATNEKYDPGSSVDDKDKNNRELRAKDDKDLDAGNDRDGDGNPDESGENDDDHHDDGLNSDKDETEEMNVDKEDMYADPTDIDLNEPSQASADEDDKMDVDQPDSIEEEVGEDEENKNDPENGDVEPDTTTIPEDETIAEAEAESNQVNDKSEEKSADESEKNDELSKDSSEQRKSDLSTDRFPNTQSSVQQPTEMQKDDSNSTAPETMWQNDLTPSANNDSMTDVLLGKSSHGNPITDQKPSELPEPEPESDISPFEKSQLNPLRDLGDALKEWKERVKMSSDLPETDNKDEGVDELMDEGADEYRYTRESEQHTDQAMGPAMPDQMEHNIGNDRPDDDDDKLGIDEDSKKPNEKSDSRDRDDNTEQIPNRSISTGKVQQINEIPDTHEEAMHVDDTELDRGTDVGPSNPGDSLVSMNNSFMNRENGRAGVTGDFSDEPEIERNLVEQLNDLELNAGARWRNYELRTTRLSQELAEQLRLIMEPTLASKLQGDYRTGKRINMKKVIPYIASHYRKDKIWLRRTKPNKRDYQVVIAVDDSRSMSENLCGEFAIEALVTVYRAMSQLEVGNLAVTSFGKAGNVRLLQDFDQPLTPEAGTQMISSLAFNQENMLLDKPITDLLRYLNNILRQAATNARTPSGQNSSQQLVLIISDGHSHECRKSIKKCLGDLLNRNCMVVFLLLDTAEQSIVDTQNFMNIMQNPMEKPGRYLDTFPFPYYIVLRNIESLPRTLADLLRQWFELMQYSRD